MFRVDYVDKCGVIGFATFSRRDFAENYSRVYKISQISEIPDPSKVTPVRFTRVDADQHGKVRAFVCPRINLDE